MPEFIDDDRQPTRERVLAPAELMALHGDGSAHVGRVPGCGGEARCEAWRDAHVADVLAVFREKPMIVEALARAELDPTAAVVRRAE